MATAQSHPRLYLAIAGVSLVLLAMLPRAATVAPTNATLSPPRSSSALPHASSSSTARLHRVSASPSTLSYARRRLLPASAFVARRQEDEAAPAPSSPQAALSPRHRAHRASSFSGTRFPYYFYFYFGGLAFSDLHDGYQRQNCGADSFHRLSRVLYGPHLRRCRDDYSDVFCVVRTIEGSRPILPCSWRAVVASGGDVCYVEVARMDRVSFSINCPAWTCVWRCTTNPSEVLARAVDAISTACGGATSTSSAAPSPPKHNAALPLLVVAFLPHPMAAAVVLFYLPSFIRADFQDELSHATCAVYPYNNNTGTVQRTRPVPGLREVCRYPPFVDPLPIFCAVRSMAGASTPSILFPWRNTWLAHPPIADPDAAAASGDRVCYVELAYTNYREGYYIGCSAGNRHARVSVPDYPEEAVRLAVWEHGMLTYRSTVGPEYERYKYGAAGPPFGDYDYDDTDL
jgi:hypothetical protein